MNAAARRLPLVARRQLSCQPARQFVRTLPRTAPHASLRVVQRYASTSAPDPSSASPAAGTNVDVQSPANKLPQEEDEVLKTGAEQDPELYVLMTVILFAFGIAGFYFGRKPTSAVSERNVGIADGTMPWEVDDAEGSKEFFKYRYHPGGDKSKPLKDAPSALNVVIVPDVNLPKSLHDQFNKWGKDESEW